MLGFGGAVPDLALAADGESVLQRVVCLAHVQADLGAALHVGIKQPVDDEERPFDPSDFPQGDRQFMLSGIGCELPHAPAWRPGPRRHGRHAAQDVGPVCRDETLLALTADQPLQLCRAGGRIEEGKTLG